MFGLLSGSSFGLSDGTLWGCFGEDMNFPSAVDNHMISKNMLRIYLLYRLLNCLSWYEIVGVISLEVLA